MSRTPAVAVTAGSLVAGLLLSGCSLSLSKKDSTPTPSPSPSTTSPTTAAPTSPAPTSSAPASPSASATVTPLTITQRLLTTPELPTLSAHQHWASPATSGAGTTPFGLCQRVDLESVGATRVVQRLWLDARNTGDSAAEQIAEFPDEATAQRVKRVLLAWHDRCRGQLTRTADAKVRPVNDLGVSVGTGGWYLVSYAEKGNPSNGRFHAFGYVVAGKRIAILRIDNGGQDYNYPPGREPMVTAVKSAAQKLSGP